jgi:diguanylate cyclase (GGDEF)-like protein
MLILLTGMAAFLLWMSQSVDDEAAQRERRIAEQAIYELRYNISHNQESSTFWDEAVEKVSRPGNDEWLDENLGTWMHKFYGFDELYILDGGNRPVYAFAADAIREPVYFETRRAVSTPFLEDLRSDLLKRQPPKEGQQTVGVSDFLLIDGRPAVVSMKPIVSDSGEIALTPETTFVHVAVQYLDGPVSERISKSFVLNGLHVAPIGSGHRDEQKVTILNERGEPSVSFEWRPFRPGHGLLVRILPLLLLVSVVLVAGTVSLSVFSYLRMRDKARNEDRLRYLSSYDSLTGLRNRAAYEEAADAIIATMESGVPVEPVAILFMDLDRFKQVNDIYGHQAGDAVLKEFAKRTKSVLPEGAELFRIGGDEFAVIHPRSSPRDAEAICVAVIDALKSPIEIAGRVTFVGVTVGVAFAPTHGMHRTEIDRKADVALYHAKAAGRGRYSIFGTQMDETMQTAAAIEEDLRTAMVDKSQFFLHYQPKFACNSGQLQGVEALARWHHPEKGAISPAAFIPVAESIGLIGELGIWVLERACRESLAWPISQLSVNVSPKQLIEPGFARSVESILVTTGFPASKLELELTESELIGSGTEAVECMRRLSDIGVSIAIDDFGTGSSNFTRLRDVEFDRIKIDQSFVRNIDSSNSDVEIVRAMITLAHARGIKATAEGVETSGQKEVLCSLGCDELQGYLLGRPCSADRIEGLLGSPTAS